MSVWSVPQPITDWGHLIRSPGGLAQPSVPLEPRAVAWQSLATTALLNSKVTHRGLAHKIDFKMVFILDLVFCDQHMHLELFFFLGLLVTF